MEDEWRAVSGYEGLYEVSSNGLVRSLDRHVMQANGKQSNGYKGKIKNIKPDSKGRRCVTLHKDGKAKRFSVARLVASAFLLNVEGRPCVIHINGVVGDDRAENLKYATYSELNKATAKRTNTRCKQPDRPIFISPNERYINGEYHEEEWLDIEGYEGLYQVSSKGRVRSIDRVLQNSRGVNRHLKGKIITPSTRATGGYPTVHLLKNGSMHTVAIHRLVAKAFIAQGVSTDGYEVDHIDSNRTNNDVNNLRYITHAENMEHMKRRGSPNRNTDGITTPEMRQYNRDKQRRPVIRNDGKMYESISEAAKDIGRTRTAVGRAVNTPGAKCAGYTFKFLERPTPTLPNR